ncbi:MAG: winged helix-turn-helix domain-containing protein [Methylococcales bacterium]|nr:winged helix-turn-helix domain-containing protein [Methylococcales bacterium]
MKKSKITTQKPVPKAKAEQPVATVVTKAIAKKPGPDLKTPKKAQAVAPKPVVATPEMPMSERAGLTAGSIWHYLAENGATPVAKLIRELPEDEKTIHRSIGWLAQEDKIILKIIDRAETISLKE